MNNQPYSQPYPQPIPQQGGHPQGGNPQADPSRRPSTGAILAVGAVGLFSTHIQSKLSTLKLN